MLLLTGSLFSLDIAPSMLYDVRTCINKRAQGTTMKTVTPTELRAEIDNLLDEVLITGKPLEIKKANRRLIIVPAEKIDKLQNLVARPEVIQCVPEDLVDISW
jgi:prevent-host-death family protein